MYLVKIAIEYWNVVMDDNNIEKEIVITTDENTHK